MTSGYDVSWWGSKGRRSQPLRAPFGKAEGYPNGELAIAQNTIYCEIIYFVLY